MPYTIITNGLSTPSNFYYDLICYFSQVGRKMIRGRGKLWSAIIVNSIWLGEHCHCQASRSILSITYLCSRVILSTIILTVYHFKFRWVFVVSFTLQTRCYDYMDGTTVRVSQHPTYHTSNNNGWKQSRCRKSSRCRLLLICRKIETLEWD